MEPWRRRRRRLTLRTGLLIAAATLLFRLPLLDWPFMLNEGGYAYTTAFWLKGLTLYSQDLWFDKPQGIFLAYLPPVLFAEGSVLAIRVWGALWVAATAVVVAAIAARVGGSALVAGLAYAFMSASPYAEGWSFDGETAMALGTAGAILAMLHGRPGLAGALACCAFLLKPAAIDAVLVAPLFLRAPAALARFIVGGTVVATAALLHGALTVGITEYVYAVVGYRIEHRTLHSVAPVTALGRAIWASPAWLGAFLVGTLAVRPAPKIAAWLVAAALGVAAGGLWTGHYFIQLMPPLAVLVGVAVTRGARPAFCTPVGVVVLLWTAGLHVLPYAHPAAFAQTWWDARSVEIGAAVHAATQPGDRVYFHAWAANALYASGRRSVTGYIFRDQLVFIPGVYEAIVREIRAGVPACVALLTHLQEFPTLRPPDPDWHELRGIVRERYRRLIPAPAEIYCR